MSGFQLFLPLSPDVVLLLFDGDVYKVGRRGNTVVSCTDPRDARILNGLQVIAAERNVLFSDAADEALVSSIASQFAAPRAHRATHVGELQAEDDSSQRLIRMHESTPNLKLDLSFVDVRRAARRVPLMDRLQTTRPGAYVDREPRRLPPGLRPGTTFREVEE